MTMRHFGKIWVLSDGKAGDVNQCIGVAEHLSADIEIRTVSPRAPWRWAMPYGPCDPAEQRAADGPLAGPLPDLVVASGRRTVPYLRALTSARGPRPFTVYLKDPRAGKHVADFIWAPDHDRLDGQNVLKTLTSPHRVSARSLERARADTPPGIAALPRPRIAVLVGGDSRHHRFLPHDIDRLCRGLRSVHRTGAGLMITTSRRTPQALTSALAFYKECGTAFVADGSASNPYLSILANADAVIVTADSVNMVGEAAALGKPVHVFRPSGGHRKIDAFLDRLESRGVISDFKGQVETGDRPVLDATPAIAGAIRTEYEKWRTARRHADARLNRKAG